MLLPDDPTANWIKLLAFGILAGVGGMMGYIMRTLNAHAPINWARAVIEGVSASFVGLLVYFSCQALNFSGNWTGVIVGLSGWLGANASIRFLETLLFDKLGLKTGSKLETNDADIPPSNNS